MSKLITKEWFHVNEHKVALRIFVENRNNVYASIVKSGVIIRLPLFMKKSQQNKYISRYKSWAISKLLEKPQLIFKPKQRIYHNGQKFQVGDKTYQIIIKDQNGTRSSVTLFGDKLTLYHGRNLTDVQKAEHSSKLVSKMVALDRYPYILDRLNSINKKYFNKQIGKLTIRNNKSNWGSCSSSGNISISTRLLFAPHDVIDYVIVHELAHLIQRNHSKNFWAIVRRIMPDYKEKVNWLNTHGQDYYF